MGLQQFERRLERLVEGAFARAFRSGLQPVEVGRRLTREMDLRRTVAPRGTLAPNAFTVWLSPEDRDRFAPIDEELVDELVQQAREHARVEGYVFIGAVEVHLDVDPSLGAGTLSISAEMQRPAKGPATLVTSEGRRITLTDRPAVLGRLPECEVVLADANVSRRHAEVAPDGDGGWVLRDLGSTNGTRHNGAPVREPVPLQAGDTITVGASTVAFEV